MAIKLKTSVTLEGDWVASVGYTLDKSIADLARISPYQTRIIKFDGKFEKPTDLELREEVYSFVESTGSERDKIEITRVGVSRKPKRSSNYASFAGP